MSLGIPAAEPTPGTFEQLRKLQLVADAALAHLGLDELFAELLPRIREILDAETCAVLLLDVEANELVARAAVGLEEEVERGVRIPVGLGFAGRIAAVRRSVRLDDVDHADILNPILREKGIKSMLGSPLISRGNVLGVIHVGTLTPRLFTDGDQELLELAAERFAQGIERALVHEKLLELDDLKRRFVALASHELRTPAAAVYGAAATLRHQKERLRDDQVESLIDILYTQSERLARLTEQLLDMSRLDASRIRLRPEEIELGAYLAALVHSLGPGTLVATELDIPEGLTVRSDREGLERIVGNLVMNAHRHGAPPVRLTARVQGEQLVLVVEDGGHGIGEELGASLFEPFHSGSSSRGGSGLGLSIAQLYAQALGGDLAYEAREPHGSRFVVTLPRSIA